MLIRLPMWPRSPLHAVSEGLGEVIGVEHVEVRRLDRTLYHVPGAKIICAKG